MSSEISSESGGPPRSEWPGANAPRFRILADQPRLGAYRLCAEVATGGMATVFLADMVGSRIRTPVAIKRIHPHLAKDQTFVDMFYDEACIASRIQHPNVCNVFDLDVHDGEYFIAMEYLVGEPLSRIIKLLSRRTEVDRNRLSHLAAAIVADACRGLHAAHELTDVDDDPLDVVHRDVSPDNIFLTYDGVAKVVDFGVASASRQLHRTRTGMLKGKYAYLQPEVLVGKRADRRGDVWGIGVVLWEFLTLRRLFHRESDFATLRAVSEAEIGAPSEVAPGIPKALDAIVLGCLTRDPDRRYSTAREVEEALVAFLADQKSVPSPRDLSQWLTALFPDGLGRQRQLIEMALRNNDTPKPSASVLRRARSLPPPSVSPALAEPVSAEPASEAPVSAEPVSEEPVSAEPVSGAPVSEPVSTEPVPTEPAPGPRAAAGPSSAEPASKTPAAAQSRDAEGTDPSSVAPREDDDALTTVFGGEDALPGYPRRPRTPTPMSMQVPGYSRPRRGLRALPTLMATLALVISVVALWSLREARIRTAREDSALEAPPVFASRGVTAPPEVPTDSSATVLPSAVAAAVPLESPLVDTAEVQQAAVTVSLPKSLIRTRRAALSTPIDLERGTYRLELEPRSDGGWALTVVPDRPVMEAKPRPRDSVARGKRSSPAFFRPTEP